MPVPVAWKQTSKLSLRLLLRGAGFNFLEETLSSRKHQISLHQRPIPEVNLRITSVVIRPWRTGCILKAWLCMLLGTVTITKIITITGQSRRVEIIAYNMEDPQLKCTTAGSFLASSWCLCSTLIISVSIHGHCAQWFDPQLSNSLFPIFCLYILQQTACIDVPRDLVPCIRTRSCS